MNSAFSAQLYGVSVVSVLQQRVSFVTILKAFILLHSCSFSLLSSVFKVKLHSLANRGAPGKSHGLSSACELICLSVQVRVLAAVWMPQHEGRDCSRMLDESASLDRKEIRRVRATEIEKMHYHCFFTRFLQLFARLFFFVVL